MTEGVAAKLKSMRMRAGLSVRGMAQALGLSPSTYVWYETAYRKRQLPPELLAKLLPVLGSRGIPAAEVLELAPRFPLPEETDPPPRGLSAPGLSEVALPELLPFGALARDVPVLGIAAGGARGEEEDDDRFILNGEVVDRVRRPPPLANAQGVFAVYVSGSSMEPRYEPGDLVYVSASQPPRIGDDVLVELAPPRDGAAAPCFIKRLVRRTASAVVCRQFNPDRELTFEAAAIRRLHRVLRLAELLGA